MKKQIFLILLLAAPVFFGCTTNDKTATAEVAAAPQAEKVSIPPMPFPATLTDDWTIGDPEKIRVVLNMYKNLEADTAYEEIKMHMAESLTNLSYDNKETKLTPEIFAQQAKKFRQGFTTLNEEFKSYVCLHSEKLSIDQVILWVKETGVNKAGVADSSVYQEDWRFNRDGKIFYRGTYMRD